MKLYGVNTEGVFHACVCIQEPAVMHKSDQELTNYVVWECCILYLFISVVFGSL